MTGTYNHVTITNSVSQTITLDESVYPSNTLFFVDLSTATNNISFNFDSSNPLTYGTEYVFVIGRNVGSNANLGFGVTNTGDTPYYGLISTLTGNKALDANSTIVFDYNAGALHNGAKITLLAVEEQILNMTVNTPGQAVDITVT